MHGSCVPAQVSNAAKATRHASVDGPTDSLLALQAVGGKLYKTLPRDKQRRMKAKAAKAKVEMVIHYQDKRGIWRVCGAEG